MNTPHDWLFANYQPPSESQEDLQAKKNEQLWRELGDVFVIPHYSFDEAFTELMRVLANHGFRRVENS